MNPNLYALLFFSPFLIMFFSFIFWIFREDKRREKQRKEGNEEWKEELRKFKGEKQMSEEPKNFSFPITDTSIIKELDSLTPEQVEKLNQILEEGLKELREKHG